MAHFVHGLIKLRPSGVNRKLVIPTLDIKNNQVLYRTFE